MRTLILIIILTMTMTMTMMMMMMMMMKKLTRHSHFNQAPPQHHIRQVPHIILVKRMK